VNVNLNIIIMSKRIISPEIGTIVKHNGFSFKNNKKYPCDVLIKSGQYEIDGRISNFWY